MGENVRGCLGVIIVVILSLLVLSQFSPPIVSEVEQENLVRNGEFLEGLTGWRTGAIRKRGIDFPIIRPSEIEGEGFWLMMDVPEPSAGYSEQEIAIPKACAVVLSFKIWGVSGGVKFRVLLFSLEKEYEIDSFDPVGKRGFGGIAIHHTYNVTHFQGMTVTLRFEAEGLSTTGSIVFLTSIKLVAAHVRHSVITIEVSNNRVFGAQTGCTNVHDLLHVKGRIFPAPGKQVPVNITFTSLDLASFFRSVIASADGSYGDVINFTRPGLWKAQSSWKGNEAYIGAASTPREFAVASHASIELTKAVVSGIEIADPDHPSFEARPGENITAAITLLVGEPDVFSNVFVLAATSWEPNHWIVLSFQLGWNVEPLNYKLIYVAPSIYLVPVHRHHTSARFETNITLNLPLRGDYFVEIVTSPEELRGMQGDAPSFVAPNSEGTYYLLLFSSAMISAHDVIDAYKVWACDPQDLEASVSGVRVDPHLQVIKLIVVDVDPHLKEAMDAINRSIRNYVDVTAAKMKYAEALAEYEKRNYSKALSLADQARELAEKGLDALVSPTRSRVPYVESLSYLSEYVVSRTDNRETVRSNLKTMKELFSEGEYGRTKILQDDLERIVTSDLIAYLTYFAMLWVGIGDLTAHLLGKYDPVELLRRTIRRVLRSRLERYHTFLAVLLIFFPAQVFQEILGSGFPPIGSLILAGSLVAGWRFPLLTRHVKPHVTRKRIS